MKLDQILRRYFWAVVGFLVAVVAFLHAQALTQIIGFYRLGLDASQLTAAPVIPRTAPSGASSARSLSADAILSRNPFDSVTGPLRAPDVAATEVAAAAPDMSDPMHAPHCEGLKVLVIAESIDPEWSFAALSTGSGAEAKSVLRRKGGEVNGKKVEWISWDRVWLASGNSLCQLEMFTPPTGKEVALVHADAGAPPPAGKEGTGSIDPELAKGIQRVSATEFKIDRGVVDKILENQAELMRQARIVPEQENGKMVGIRLFGVRPDTLLGVLGMENGDRLQTINGFDMTSPEKALEAYARLRTADTLTVQVNRRGANTNLDYHIQ
jgi:general secretion pathway protein C